MPSLDGSLSVGLAYRFELKEWIDAHSSILDVLELTVDHYLNGNSYQRAAIVEMSSRFPIVGHGVGLSVGTAAPMDESYLDKVAEIIDVLRMPWYSEHLAFTKVPGIDLAQLLPLHRTRAVAERVIANIRKVQSYLPVPLLLENITYYFDYPSAEFTEAEFLNLICRETGTMVLLDVENTYLNSKNHGYRAQSFLDELPPGIIKGIHVAGGSLSEDVLIDSHDRPVPEEAFALLSCILERHSPDSIILERDERLENVEEIGTDLLRLRAEIQGTKPAARC